jgi:hypothetical protein
MTNAVSPEKVGIAPAEDNGADAKPDRLEVRTQNRNAFGTAPSPVTGSIPFVGSGDPIHRRGSTVWSSPD